MNVRPPPGRRPLTQNEKDRLLTQQRLLGFDPETCTAKVFLTRPYGPNINGRDLVSLAETCAFYLNIYLDREARRRTAVLWKWFDENLHILTPFLQDRVVVETRNHGMIGNKAAIQIVRDCTNNDASTGPSPSD
jgi:hypothetical protein